LPESRKRPHQRDRIRFGDRFQMTFATKSVRFGRDEARMSMAGLAPKAARLTRAERLLSADAGTIHLRAEAAAVSAMAKGSRSL